MSTPPRWTVPANHDAKSCPTCGPYVSSPAYRRGVNRAKAQVVRTTEGMDRDA